MKARFFLFILLALVISACSGAEVDTGAATTHSAGDNAPAGARPTTTTQTSPVETASGVIFGRNDDGTFFHGVPDAPVTFIDYSDFL